MSKLTKAERDKLPESSFADPANRLFPILDQDDVDSAARLIGKAKNPGAVKKRVIAIAKRLKLSIPDAWKDDAKMTATFALDSGGRRVEGDYAIYPNALLFEAGSYPDKKLDMTPEEMWAATEQFTPVWGNIEHTDFMRGKACEVRSIRLDEGDPFTLRGELAVPLWLDENLDPQEKKLSCEWDRSDKTLSGIALTVSPRITQAALMSAYAEFAKRHDTPTGKRGLQHIHDVSVQHGAVCKATNGSAKMASGHENAAIQRVHDEAVAHGAICESIGGSGDVMPLPWYSKGKAASGTTSTSSKGKAKMADRNKFLKWLLNEDGVADDADVDMGALFAEDAPAKDKAAREETAKLRAEFAQAKTDAEKTAETLRTQLAEERAHRIESEAVAFAEKTVLSGKALPAEREALIAAFRQATMDDGTHGVVTFAEGKTASRVSLLQALYEARPAHTLTEEQVAERQKQEALFSKEKTDAAGAEKPISLDRRRELLAMSKLGQQALAADAAKS